MSYVPTRGDLYEKISSIIELLDELHDTAISARDNTDFTCDEAVQLSKCAAQSVEASIMMNVFIKRLNLKEEQDEN